MKSCFYLNVTSDTNIIANPEIELFHEAIAHCRWKTVCRNFINNLDISQYANHTFEEIFAAIFTQVANINGVGLLTIYDITAAICRHYNINIERVYIIGGGPRRAIRILNIRAKRQKINGEITLKYVDIEDVIAAFDKNSINHGFNHGLYVLDETMRNNRDGNLMESYLCNWQKKIKE
jgi:hypothetical protein